MAVVLSRMWVTVVEVVVVTADAASSSDPETIGLDICEVTNRLNKHLGATLVATLANVNDRRLPYQWLSNGSIPDETVAMRLRAAHEIWLMVSDAESDDIARAWFIGENALLNEMAPVLALREGMTRETITAARSYLNGAWNN